MKSFTFNDTIYHMNDDVYEEFQTLFAMARMLNYKIEENSVYPEIITGEEYEHDFWFSYKTGESESTSLTLTLTVEFDDILEDKLKYIVKGFKSYYTKSKDSIEILKVVQQKINEIVLDNNGEGGDING